MTLHIKQVSMLALVPLTCALAADSAIKGNFAGAWSGVAGGGEFRISVQDEGGGLKCIVSFTAEGTEVKTNVTACKIDGSKIEVQGDLDAGGDRFHVTMFGELQGNTLTGKYQLKALAASSVADEGDWKAVSVLAAAVKVAREAAPSQKFSPKLLGDDFKVFRSALEEGHSGIYRYTKKSDLDHLFDEAAQKLDHPMDEIEFYGILAPVVAGIRCGHTGVASSEEFQKELASTVPLFPFDVEVLANKVYIFRDYSAGNGSLAGLEILQINGLATENILHTMLSATTGDGQTPTAGPWRLGHGGRFPSRLFLLTGIRSPFEVVLRDRASSERTVEVTGIEEPKRKQMSEYRYPQDQMPDHSAELQFLDNGQIAVLRVLGFHGSAGTGPKKPLGQFFDDAFQAIHAKGAKALILDVRNNGGGADELGKKLFSFLTDQPFQYYNDLVLNASDYSFFRYVKYPPKLAGQFEKGPDGKFHNTKHPNWGIQQPSTPHFGGRVLVLINGGSFSTTCEFLSTLHFHKRATFIGEEAAGGYYGNSSGIMPLVILPNSKLTLRVPLQTYYLAVSGFTHPDRSIPPDYPVRHSIEDLLSGADREMMVALQLARGADDVR